MSETNLNLDALNKLNKAFRYADAIRQRSDIGDDTVLYLEDGQQLTCRYSTDDFPKDIFHFRRTRNESQKQLNNETRELFKQMVIDIFGTSIDDVPKSVRSAMELSKFDGAGRPLTARRIMAVNKAILSAMKGVNKLLGLSGAAAGNIAMIVARGSGILAAEDPANELQQRSTRHAKAQVTTHIANEMYSIISEHSRIDAETGTLLFDTNLQFDKDIVRTEVITLKGKKMSSDSTKARNELVQFITGRKRATFDEADNQTKLKACILMCLAQQGTFGCSISAIGSAFDPNGSISRIMPGSVTHEGSKMLQTFALTKDKQGNITVAAKIRFTAPVHLGLRDGENHFYMKRTDAKESYVEYKLEIKLSTADMDKLSLADWRHYDKAEISATERNEALPNRFEEAANLIPDAFKYTGDVKVSCHIHAQEVRDN